MRYLAILYFCLCLPCASFGKSFSDQMTPLDCIYTSEDVNVVRGKDECGNYSNCNGAAECTYVSNEVLAKEFGGSEEKAKAAAKGAWDNDLWPLQIGKNIWSEATGAPPKFLVASTSVYCQSRSGRCLDAFECLKDKKVNFVGKEPLENNMTKVFRPQLPGASK